MNKQDRNIFYKLQDTAKRVIPPGGRVWLYGSHARGDAHEYSDWDLLILLDQPSITVHDENEIAYPFVVEGWKNNQAVSPQLYTFDEWSQRSFTPYYKNIEHDKLTIL